MSNERSKGYITDIAYTSGFYSDLSPVTLAYISAINGVSPPVISGDFNYCELGCGNGHTTNIFASCFPKAHFWGIDVNPEHIKNAQEEANLGGLKNITFLDISFSEAEKMEFPQFDFITLHGIWSWVSQEVRSEIIRFLGTFLKPGGLVYVSYNAFPGWASLMPIRQMMLSYTEFIKADPITKAKQGIAYLKYLKEHDSPFFIENPPAAKMVELLENHDIRYIVHEYFNSHWAPAYFFEVEKDMRRAGLEFIGVAPIEFNHQFLSIPDKFKELFSTVDDRIVLEIHKSFVNNEKFRKDIYLKPKSGVSHKQSNLLKNFYFGTLKTTDKLSTTVEMYSGTVTFNEEIYMPIMKNLSEGAKTIEQLCDALNQPKSKIPELTKNVINLVISGQFMPFANKTNKKEIPANYEKMQIISQYNKSQLTDYLYKKDVIHFASEKIGSGIAINKIQAILLIYIERLGFNRNRVCEAVWEDIAKNDSQLTDDDGVKLVGKEANISKLNELYDETIQKSLPVLIDLELINVF